MTKQDGTTEAVHGVGRGVRLVKRVYTAIMQNTLLRSKLAASSLSDDEWRNVDGLMAHSNEEEWESHDVESLYAGVRATLIFTKLLAKEIKPLLKNERLQAQDSTHKETRVVLEMTLSNLDENISLLHMGLKGTFEAVQRLEEENFGTSDVLRSRFPELEDEQTWQDLF